MKRGLFTVGTLISIALSVLVLSPQASAADSQVQVLVGDVCPNIAGNQPVIPSGMEFDQNGDCYTPTPPPPPDACPNIDGYQTAIPNGYYRNGAGNCVVQTNPPKDVCPNISGRQSSVPQGMQTAENGDCIQPPQESQDRCPNIPGIQIEIPTGMSYDEAGSCFTPTPTPPSGTGSKPGNEPKQARSTFLDSLLPDIIKELLRHTSPTLVHTLPYYIIGALTIVALFLLRETLREALLARQIFAVFMRKKRRVTERDDLIALLCRHLNTIITAMRAGLDADSETPHPLLQPLMALQNNITHVKEAVVASTQADTPNASAGKTRHSTHRSLLFWIPTLLTGLIVITLNVLFNIASEVVLNTPNLILQAVAFLATVLLFYVAVRSRRLRHIQRQQAQVLSRTEDTVDISHESFIVQIINLLRSALKELDDVQSQDTEASPSQEFLAGYAGLITAQNRLTMIEQARAGTTVAARYDIRDIIQDSLIFQQTSIDAQKLTLTDTSDSCSVTQNRVLLGSVLSSVIETLVGHTPEGGSLLINTVIAPKKLVIEISSPEAKLNNVELEILQGLSNVNQASLESLHFILDKIIMSEIEGAITVNEALRGTVFVVTIPV